MSPQQGFTSSSLEYVTDDYAVTAWRNVLVVEWRERTTGEGVRDVHLRLQNLSRSYAGGVLYLAFVTERAAPPDAEARQALANMLKVGGPYILAGAVIFDGSGFRGAFVRGVATGLAMLAMPSFPFVVCSLEAAARLFADKAAARNQGFAADRFLAEIPGLRAAIFSQPDSGRRTAAR